MQNQPACQFLPARRDLCFSPGQPRPPSPPDPSPHQTHRETAGRRGKSHPAATGFATMPLTRYLVPNCGSGQTPPASAAPRGRWHRRFPRAIPARFAANGSSSHRAPPTAAHPCRCPPPACPGRQNGCAYRGRGLIRHGQRPIRPPATAASTRPVSRAGRSIHPDHWPRTSPPRWGGSWQTAGRPAAAPHPTRPSPRAE